MILRLQQLLQAENISRTQFAELLEISPATVTHLLSGRNKPSFELIQSISARFPNLNLDWLINGNGKMYKDGSNPLSQGPVSPADDQEFDLFASANESNTLDKPKQTIENKPVIIQKKINKITIFYTDGTFQEIPVK